MISPKRDELKLNLSLFYLILIYMLLSICFSLSLSPTSSAINQVSTSTPVYYQYENHTLLSMTTEMPTQQQKPCKWTCELTNDRGYVVYSALGSFYIPMFVMLFFYWRIYRAAVRTTRAINQGFKTTKGKIWTTHQIIISHSPTHISTHGTLLDHCSPKKKMKELSKIYINIIFGSPLSFLLFILIIRFILSYFRITPT